jgi:protein-tyrosine phosphatase
MQKILFFSLVVFSFVALPSSCAKADVKPNNPYNLYKFPQKHSYIALSPLPGRVDLESDLKMISDNGVQNVVTLVSSEELSKYGVPGLLERFGALNIEVLHSPVTDYGLPSVEQAKTIISWVHKRVKAKENVLIHCVGGLGRSGTIMAVYARAYLGKTGEEAIQFVRSIRGEAAIETEEQQNFVKSW